MASLCTPAVPAARDVDLPAARDLAADAALGARERSPILLFFNRDDCPYCERALREYLAPMSRDGAWRSRAIYRQVEVDRPHPLTGFDGAATTHSALASRYRVSLTPTVLVVDTSGRPLAEPLVGLSPDFYAAYLEAAIETAEKRLRP